MDFFLSRYRNLTVLLIVIVAQLLLIAYQVKSNNDVPLIRVWAVTAVTPVEQGLELVRRYTWGFVEDYFVLLRVRSQNEKLQARKRPAEARESLSEIRTLHRGPRPGAERVSGAFAFKNRGGARDRKRNRRQFQSGLRGSRVGQRHRERNGGGDAGRDRRQSGGRLSHCSLVMLVTDPTFAAGVISQKESRARHAQRPGPQRSAWWTTRKTKKRWKTANGSTPPATIGSFREASRWARSAQRPQRQDLQGNLPRRPAGCKAAWKKC